MTVALAYYHRARAAVVAAGYQEELDWQAGVRLDDHTGRSFLVEHSFVVCNSGMRASVVAGFWPRLRAAFHDWPSAEVVALDREGYRVRALRVLNSPPKIAAMIEAARRMHQEGWEATEASLRAGGVAAVATWPYMGPIIRWHLAKNLGLDVAKPDRHLVRIAAAFGSADVQAFCRGIASATGDRVAVVDLVLWRYASTVWPGYQGELPGQQIA